MTLTCVCSATHIVVKYDNTCDTFLYTTKALCMTRLYSLPHQPRALLYDRYQSLKEQGKVGESLIHALHWSEEQLLTALHYLTKHKLKVLWLHIDLFVGLYNGMCPGFYEGGCLIVCARSAHEKFLTATPIL